MQSVLSHKRDLYLSWILILCICALGLAFLGLTDFMETPGPDAVLSSWYMVFAAIFGGLSVLLACVAYWERIILVVWFLSRKALENFNPPPSF